MQIKREIQLQIKSNPLEIASPPSRRMQPLTIIFATIFNNHFSTIFFARFAVVADRMRSARNVEDIKDRFYFIMRRLLEERNLAGENTPENVLYSRPFDKPCVLTTPLAIAKPNRYLLQKSTAPTGTNWSASGSWSTSSHATPPSPYRKKS